MDRDEALKSEYEFTVYGVIDMHRLMLAEGMTKARKIDEDIRSFLEWSAEHRNIGYDEDMRNIALKAKARALEFESRDAFYGHRVCRKNYSEIKNFIPEWRNELKEKIEKCNSLEVSFNQSQKAVYEAQLSECDVLEELLEKAKKIFDKNVEECPDSIIESAIYREHQQKKLDKWRKSL